MTAAPKKIWITCAIITGFGLFLTPAASQADECVPVTDAEELAAMGFDSDADVVDCTDGSESDAAAVADEAQPDTGPFFSPISAKEFIGRVDATGTSWRYNGGPRCCVDLTRVGTEQFADAQFTVPDGTIDFFRWWAFDNVTADIAFFVFRVCQPTFAAGAPSIVTIVNTSTSTVAAAGDKSGAVAIATANQTLNNRDCSYLARVRFDAASASLALQKVRLQGTAS